MWQRVHEQTLHDRYLAGDAFWVWKEESQGSWGVFDFANGVWTERPQVIAWISRVHAARIAGTVVSNEYAAGTLHLEAHDTDGVAHSIYTPTEMTLTCKRITSPRDPATGLVEAPCDGMLVVAP